jgi:hypothetical protein
MKQVYVESLVVAENNNVSMGLVSCFVNRIEQITVFVTFFLKRDEKCGVIFVTNQNNGCCGGKWI